jgi:hypothetical protein
MRVSRFDQPGTVLWPDVNVYSLMGWITDHWATNQEEPKQYICSENQQQIGSVLSASV